MVLLARTTPWQFVALTAGAYLNVNVTVLVVKVYSFKYVYAAIIAKELVDEISILDKSSVSVKLYKQDIDDELTYKMLMAIPY